MSTFARFEFDEKHQPGTCTPAPGLIEGTLYPDLAGGTYVLEFLGEDEEIARTGEITTEGDPVPLAVEHEREGGLANVVVRIRRLRRAPASTRTQIPQRVCLA